MREVLVAQNIPRDRCGDLYPVIMCEGGHDQPSVVCRWNELQAGLLLATSR